MMDVQKLLEEKARLILIIIGLALILAGNISSFTLLKIDISNLFAEVGALLLIVGVLHSIFETNLRKQVLQDVLFSAVGGNRICQSGVVDAVHNSREISYERIIESNTQRLIVGEHYSARFFEDYSPQIRNRLNQGGNITVALLKQGTTAEKYLRESNSGRSNISESLEKIKGITRSNSSSNGTVTKPKSDLIVKWHCRVLRYSFVACDDLIWIRFFTNAQGYSHVPAICVTKGTPMFEFFDTDIIRLLEQSEDDV